MSVVIAINKKTGVESPMTLEVWNQIQNNPHWKGVFYLKTVNVPPEVTRLLQAKEQTKKGL